MQLTSLRDHLTKRCDRNWSPQKCYGKNCHTIKSAANACPTILELDRVNPIAKGAVKRFCRKYAEEIRAIASDSGAVPFALALYLELKDDPAMYAEEEVNLETKISRLIEKVLGIETPIC